MQYQTLVMNVIDRSTDSTLIVYHIIVFCTEGIAPKHLSNP